MSQGDSSGSGGVGRAAAIGHKIKKKSFTHYRREVVIVAPLVMY